MSETRLAIVLSHATQYYSPWFRWLRAHTSLSFRVFYLSDFGLRAAPDEKFAQAFAWDVDLTSGYDWEIVPNTAARPDTLRYDGLRNPEIFARLRRYAPSAVLLFGYKYHTHLRLIVWARLTGLPLIFRGDSHVIGRGRLPWKTRWALHLLYAQFGAITYVGRANRDYFRRCGVAEHKLFFAPHAIDAARFISAASSARSAAASLRAELGLTGKRVVLFAGKLIAAKQPRALLDAFIAVNLPDTALVFVGDGAEKVDLMAEAQRHPDVKISFLPFANQSEMPTRYALADLLVLPSRGAYETWGLVVNEAMHLGVPALVSDQVGCQRDLVDDGKTGWVFEADSPDSLRSKLREALSALRDADRTSVFRDHVHERIALYTYAQTSAGLQAALAYCLRRYNVSRVYSSLVGTSMTAAGSARPTSDRSFTERLAFFHLVFLLLFSAWAFGGNIAWAARDICWIGSAGIIITAIEGARRFRSGRGSLKPLWILLPWLLFNAVVVLSTLHPSFRLVHVEGADVYLPNRDVSHALPTTARPDLTWRALWLFDALFLPAFNVLLAFRSRRLVRVLLLIFSANAVILAVLGSLQKLSHASGIYFGRIHSPNTKFFATFIYDNHWGAFAVLAIAAGLGLIFHRSHFASTRDFLNSPAFGASLAMLLLAASVPLSSSRSCTALVLIVIGAALLHALRRIVASQRARSESSYRPLLAIFFVSSVTFIAIYTLARPVILKRVEETREQIETFERTRSFGARPTLYRDTWHMAQDRPLFGWGMGSYGTVFTQYNTQVAIDRLPQYYEDAHSDWLQALAETGWVGGILRACMVILPAITLLRSRPWRPSTAYPLFGCVLILLYALVEFPFGNVAVSLAWWACWFSAVRLAQLDARETQP